MSVFEVDHPATQADKRAHAEHVGRGINVSRNLQRATLMWTDYRGDAWMYRVVKP